MAKPDVTGSEIRQMLIAMLATTTDASEARWAKLIPAVEVHSLAAYPESNWSVRCSVAGQNRIAFKKAVEILRAHHPYASAG